MANKIQHNSAKLYTWADKNNTPYSFLWSKLSVRSLGKHYWERGRVHSKYLMTHVDLIFVTVKMISTKS